ncbi:MBL fold metallo-hydrolase [Methylocystis bryophila]|nr:MBL fold metallo-hydrolase [Methylocystis bryophila]
MSFASGRKLGLLNFLRAVKCAPNRQKPLVRKPRDRHSMTQNPIDFETRFPPERDARPVRVSPLTRRLVAPNGGPFTYTGTCAYIVGAGEVAIVDPGPKSAAHVEALLEAVAGERLAAILVTHTHRDHAPAAALLRDRTGAPIVGCAPYRAAERRNIEGPALDAAHDANYAPDRVLEDGETLAVGGATLQAVATPGHTANHLCFALMEEQTLFTGDHVMAWATTVIAPPDGSMRAYMRSVEKLLARDDRLYWPAHGGPIADPRPFLRALLLHRRQREASILRRLEAGDATIPSIVDKIYAGVDKRLHAAAAMVVLAHLEDLVERGEAAAPEGLGLFARYARV